VNEQLSWTQPWLDLTVKHLTYKESEITKIEIQTQRGGMIEF